MVAKLLGVDDDSIESTVINPMQTINNSNIASTIVHVLERREIPARPDKSFATTGVFTFNLQFSHNNSF